MNPVVDFLGRKIVAGNLVLYPVRRGSNMWLNKLQVTQVIPGPKPTVSGFGSTGRRVTLHNIANLVVVVDPVEKG